MTRIKAAKWRVELIAFSVYEERGCLAHARRYVPLLRLLQIKLAIPFTR